MQVETYTIKNGDTLKFIAEKFSSHPRELRRLNPWIRNPNKLWAGVDMLVPRQDNDMLDAARYRFIRENMVEFTHDGMDLDANIDMRIAEKWAK